tara:strand:+ start:4320 stop:4511 length:192 start_codon:yes stop_codon:yes gene_type:complete
MGEAHVEVVVLDGIEKAPELLVGTFYVVEELKDFEDDQEAGYHSGHVLLIEEYQVNKGRNGDE